MTGRTRLLLSNHEMLVELTWGGYVVVPTYNLDVAIGAIRDGVIEPWTTEMVLKSVHPGQVVLNVGANFGYYTALLGRLVGNTGSVISIEANPYLLNYLVKSTYYNGTPNQTHIHSFAAWETDGTFTLEFNPAFIGGGSVVNGTKQPSQSMEEVLWAQSNLSDLVSEPNFEWNLSDRSLSVEVPTRALDEVVKQSIDFMLMDVEGSEPYVIMGMQQIFINSPKLRFIAEWSPDYLSRGSEYQNKVRSMIEFLEAQGYRAQHINPVGYPNWALGKSFAPSDLLDQPTGDYLWTRI